MNTAIMSSNNANWFCIKIWNLNQVFSYLMYVTDSFFLCCTIFLIISTIFYSYRRHADILTINDLITRKHNIHIIMIDLFRSYRHSFRNWNTCVELNISEINDTDGPVDTLISLSVCKRIITPKKPIKYFYVPVLKSHPLTR